MFPRDLGKKTGKLLFHPCRGVFLHDRDKWAPGSRTLEYGVEGSVNDAELKFPRSNVLVLNGLHMRTCRHHVAAHRKVTFEQTGNMSMRRYRIRRRRAHDLSLALVA